MVSDWISTTKSVISITPAPKTHVDVHVRWSFFIAFFIWFSIAPLLPEIKETLDLDHKEIWTSNIVGVAGTVVMRFILGPACDKYGARVLFTAVLCFASIPTALTGIVETAAGLAVIRLFIGVAGGCFVMCQYWSSRMFTKEVVGTANALVGGWGNLGGGVTQLVMGAALFPLFKLFYDGNAEKAWRTVCVVPAVVAFVTGIVVYFISDDAPKGNYSDLKKHGTMAEVSAAASFRSGACNLNTWILFIQYGCCFGVELTMNNAAALYFVETFDQTTESAAAIASIFGWMNLFARGLGGYSSDAANNMMGVKGRLWVQTALLLIEGAMVLVFANTHTLAGSIIVMVFFSLFVQAAEGSTYGIVPYVDPPSTGSIAGIVGAGGNCGAVAFGFAFRQLDDYKSAVVAMGATILASSLLTVFVVVKGHAGMLSGRDDPMPTKAATLLVPSPDNNEEEEEVAESDEGKPAENSASVEEQEA
jgi:NNP family nitrate/nitrite transporter-like MFS transporter